MVMQNKALICALYVLINSQYASNDNKLLVNSEKLVLKIKCYSFFFFFFMLTKASFI